MKRFLIVYLLCIGWTSVAYSQLPSLNTTHVLGNFQSRTPAQWRSFANDLDTAFMPAWARTFSLSHADSTEFIFLDFGIKQQFVSACRYIANQIDSGRAVDFSGVSITNNGNLSTSFSVHTDVAYAWVPQLVVTVSMWITKDKN